MSNDKDEWTANHPIVGGNAPGIPPIKVLRLLYFFKRSINKNIRNKNN